MSEKKSLLNEIKNINHNSSNIEELILFFERISELVRTHNKESLKEISAHIEDPYIKYSIELVSDSTSSELLESLIDNKLQSLIITYKQRLTLINKAIKSINHGDSPFIVKAVCKSTQS